MTESLDLVDIADEHSQADAFQQPERASEAGNTEPAKGTFGAAAVNPEDGSGYASPVVTHRSSDIHRAAIRNASTFCGQVATTWQDIGWRTMRHLRRSKEDRPLRLLCLIAGVAFTAGLAIRFLGSSHE